jgi:putative ABC transport system permease protein
MLAGSATGLIYTRLRVNPLLAGILVMTALYSINLTVMGKPNIPLSDFNGIISSFYDEGNKIFYTLSIIVLIVATVSMLLYRLLKTDYGIAIRATGNNEKMATANGVNVNLIKITGLALANGLTALSGYIIIQYQGYADINMGVGIVISGLAAVMIGDALTSFFGRNNISILIVAVIAGSILFRLVIAQALAFGLNPNFLKLITAVIVLLIIGLTQLRKKS